MEYPAPEETLRDTALHNPALTGASPEDTAAELARLRAEVATLREINAELRLENTAANGGVDYAVVFFGRWSEQEEPRALVIYSTNGRIWQSMCETDPDNAQEIAEALIAKEWARRESAAQERDRLEEFLAQERVRADGADR